MRTWAFVIGLIIGIVGVLLLLPGFYFSVGGFMVKGPVMAIITLVVGLAIIGFSFTD